MEVDITGLVVGVFDYAGLGCVFGVEEGVLGYEAEGFEEAGAEVWDSCCFAKQRLHEEFHTIVS